MLAIYDQLDRIVIIPIVDNKVNDIYLMIAVFIQKKVTSSAEIHNLDKNSLFEIIEEPERLSLYSETRKIFEEIKVVFSILDDSHLLNQIDIIKTNPNYFEVTLRTLIKEFNVLTNKLTTRGI